MAQRVKQSSNYNTPDQGLELDELSTEDNHLFNRSPTSMTLLWSDFLVVFANPLSIGITENWSSSARATTPPLVNKSTLKIREQKQ